MQKKTNNRESSITLLTKKYTNKKSNPSIFHIYNRFSTLIQFGISFYISLTSILLCILYGLGIAVSNLLLLQSFDANNPFINKLCSSGSGNGCNNILGASASKILNGTVSWSEIRFFYFLTSFCTLCFSGSWNITISFLTIVNILALPYTAYSVWYQYRSKSCCRLCLSVQVILWLIFFITVSNFSLAVNFTFYQMPLFLFVSVLVISVSLWIIIKPFIVNNQQIAKLQRDINLFKKDENIFYTLLEQQREVTPLSQQHKIVFGNPDAAFEITFVSNPYCMPCSEMHKKLHLILEECRNDLALSIIYTASSSHGDPKNKIIQILIDLYKKSGSNSCEKAMNEWYEEGIKNPNIWIEKYKTLNPNITISETLDMHRIWCEENDITHTPALFFNNHLYLTEYNFKDLVHFIRKARRIEVR